MECPNCHAINYDHRSYCKACGERLRHHCAQCGFGNERGDHFCGGCGSKTSLSAEAAPGPAPVRQGAAPPAHASNLPSQFLAELFKEPAEIQPKSRETKKAVTQEEIDKLFNP